MIREAAYVGDKVLTNSGRIGRITKHITKHPKHGCKVVTWYYEVEFEEDGHILRGEFSNHDLTLIPEKKYTLMVWASYDFYAENKKEAEVKAGDVIVEFRDPYAIRRTEGKEIGSILIEVAREGGDR